MMRCPCHDTLCPLCGVPPADRRAALRAQWYPLRRLRQRRVDLHAAVTEALRTAIAVRKGPVIRAVHGGGVGGRYKAAAETEAVLIAAWPDGAVWWRLVTLDAHKLTLARAASAVLPFARPIYDRRYTSAHRAEVYRQLLIELRKEARPWALLRRIGEAEGGPFARSQSRAAAIAAARYYAQHAGGGETAAVAWYRDEWPDTSDADADAFVAAWRGLILDFGG